MSWFNTASDGDEISRDKVTVSRKSATSVDVSFSSGKLAAALIWHTHHCPTRGHYSIKKVIYKLMQSM